MSSSATSPVQIGPSKFQVGDLIIHYRKYCGPIHPENLITIQDANSKPYLRDMPASLIAVRQAAVRVYGRTEERIRCGVCGARKIPQVLINGRCDVCNEEFWKGYVPEKARHHREDFRDVDLLFPGMYRPLERGC